jgi:hypothetical protein
MTITVSVSTADGEPIQDGVSIAVNDGPSNSIDKGQLTLTADAWPLDLTVTRQQYNPQSISIGLDASGSPIWDDPGSFVSKSGTDLTVRVQLGRMKPAPTKPWGTRIAGLEYANSNIAITKAVLDSFGKDAHGNPVLFNMNFIQPLQHTFTRADGQYAFLYAGKTRFYAATSPQLLGDNDGEQGWKCFNAQPSDIDPLTQGHFTFVEWTSPEADSQDLRYLVALWRPRSAAAATAANRDVIVFYTPNAEWNPGGTLFFPKDTSPYRGYYPYAANQRGLDGSEKDPQVLAQRYVELGLRYLFNERHLVYDLLAAGRDALVMVPINLSGHWEIFGQPDGLERALSEAILFERRAQDDPTMGPLDTAPARLEVRVLRPYPAPPSLGTVVVAGTSGGRSAVQPLLQTAIKGGPALSLADLYRSDPTRLYASWREVWDFELAQKGYGAKRDWATTLISWQRAGSHYQGGLSDRIVRFYHAQYTDWTADDLELMRKCLSLVPGASVQTTQRASKNGGHARELEGPTGTAVWFSRQFLERNGPAPDWNTGDQPAFWEGDQHHVVSTICFAHAASVSRLRRV